MPTVKLPSGKEVTLPSFKEFYEKDTPDNLTQLGLRALYLKTKDGNLTDEQLPILIDDMIYLLLDFWKSTKVEEPFKTLYEMVDQNLIQFESSRVQKLLCDRIKENHSLINTFKNGTGKVKTEARRELQERGFIGGREVAWLTNDILKDADTGGKK
jgi:hypothetical protein